MARNVIQLQADISRAKKRFRILAEKFEREGQLSVRELADMGKQYARQIAPYYSGATVRHIKLFRGKTRFESYVQAQNPTRSDGHRRRISNFNLVRWMHQSPKAQSHIYSGDPQFMFTTRQYLSERAPGMVRGRFNKVITSTR